MGISAGVVIKPHHNQTLCNRFWIAYNQPLGFRLSGARLIHFKGKTSPRSGYAPTTIFGGQSPPYKNACLIWNQNKSFSSDSL